MANSFVLVFADKILETGRWVFSRHKLAAQVCRKARLHNTEQFHLPCTSKCDLLGEDVEQEAEGLPNEGFPLQGRS